MLESIRISNFILIDELVIDFAPGFTVLTGETGAGKSIILGALSFLFGEKPKTLPLRDSEKDAVVEAVFDLSSLSAVQLQELPDISRGESVSISRSISSSGRSKVLVNGNLATLPMLQNLTGNLVNICGQNQHVKLLQSAYHLNVLDSFGRLQGQISDYEIIYRKYKELQVRVEELEAKALDAVRQRSFLTQVIEDLKPLKLTAELKDELERDQQRLSGGEKLLALSARFEEELLKGEGGFRAIEKSVRSISAEVHKLDPAAVQIHERSQAFITVMHELEVELAGYLSAVECDESRLEETRGRLSQIARFERKYRCEYSELLKLFLESTEELKSFDDESYLIDLKNQCRKVKEEAEALAGKLTLSRKAAFGKLKKKVEEGLKSLHMPAFRMECDFSIKELSPSGADKIQFLVATNPGETPKPLGSVASGGELSRLTLVLKEALQDASAASVFLFDEVDTGVSGKVARAVGDKLRSLAKFSQVLCVTHLPQVASLADSHLYVEKEIGSRSTTSVRQLKPEERVEEVARMLSGEKVTRSSRESARELLASNQ